MRPGGGKSRSYKKSSNHNPCPWVSCEIRKKISAIVQMSIVTCFLQRWNNGISSQELEGREAKHLGSLSREGNIDREIGKGAQALTLWRQLLSGSKEWCSFKEDVICHQGNWTTMQRGIFLCVTVRCSKKFSWGGGIRFHQDSSGRLGLHNFP